MSDPLRVERAGASTRLRLNRPDKANALSPALVDALLAALDEAHRDGTRLLVLEGEGRHFCAGFDFGDLDDCSDGDLALRFLRIELLLQGLYHAPFDTLALAHGRTFGAGADLVACCSRRVATPDARFRLPGLRFGLVLGTRRLAHRIGADAARRVLGSSAEIDASEALGIGLLTEVAGPGEWDTKRAQALDEACMLTPSARAALHRRTLEDTREADLAALAASVAAPGLADRIRAFRKAPG